MNRLLLFGDIRENYPDMSRRLFFGDGNGFRSMVLILQNAGIAELFLPLTDLWQKKDGCDCRTVLLSEPGWQEEAAAALNEAELILVGPGKTMVYREALLNSPVGGLIRRRVSEGVTFAGISAGAMLAGELLARDTETGVAVFPALGLLKGVCVEPHYDTAGRDASLRYQMEHTGLRLGLGIGSECCAEIVDGRNVTVHGNGECVVRKAANGDSAADRVFDAGGSFAL